MPLLGGLFSRKSKGSSHPKHDDPATQTRLSATPSDSNLSLPSTSSYIAPDKGVPSYPNARNLLHPHQAYGHILSPAISPTSTQSSSSGGKIRFFGRKKSSGPDLSSASTTDLSLNSHNTSSRPAQQHRATAPSAISSDTGSSDARRMRPPPSRSAIFAAYGDPNGALSTRSLPNDNSLVSSPPSSLPTASSSPPQPPQKRPSLFVWGKQTSSPISQKSVSPGTVSPKDASDSPSHAQDSFNLKSFRHIRPPSPGLPHNASNSSLSAPIPRPRGPSIHSDPSQRISVAAFREAQARRSLAGSPSPSHRSPSPTPVVSSHHDTSEIPKGYTRPRRGSSVVLTTESDSDLSDQDSIRDRNRPHPGKARTTRSEVGHGYIPQSSFNKAQPPLPRGPRSHVGHGTLSNQRPLTHFELKDDPVQSDAIPGRSQSSLGYHGDRGNASNTFLSPPLSSRHANRYLSTEVQQGGEGSKALQNRTASHSQLPTKTTKATVTSSASQRDSQVTSDSDSDDNAPLATLVAPKRPGSALSSYSSQHSRSTGNVTTRPSQPKPLIDINELKAPPKRSYTSPEKESNGFTAGRTLLSEGKASFTQSPLAESPISAWNSGSEDGRPATARVAPVNFGSPPPSPPRTTKALMSDSSTDSNTKSLPQVGKALEQKRVPISDRLTRAVKTTTTPTPAQMAKVTSAPQTIEKSPPWRGGDGTRSPLSGPPPTLSRTNTPPDEDLAQLLGNAGIKFISRTGDSPESSDTESEDLESPSTDRIAPIPIKHRSPPLAFSVTSRPPFPRQQNASGSLASPTSTQPPNRTRQRSSTLLPPSSSPLLSTKVFPQESNKQVSSTSHITSKSLDLLDQSKGSEVPTATKREWLTVDRPGPGARPRSSTMLAGIPLSQQRISNSNSPVRPFAVRGNSPSSSTGDSSSSRVPVTPRDGSDIGISGNSHEQQKKPVEDWSGGATGLGIKRGHVKRRSVSFEEDQKDLLSKGHLREDILANRDASPSSGEEARESRRRGRRRSEARAAIELGNIVNGPRPLVDDDDVPINQTANGRMSTANPMMSMGNGLVAPNFSGPTGWGLPMGQQILSPAQFMVPPPSDANFLAAHQQAMMFAKQAYQMAVAQQAMAAAADEWERGSAMGGISSGGSAYGGATGLPAMPMMTPFNMMPFMQGGWSGAASMYGGGGSVYGGSLGPGDAMFNTSRSEYGGHTSRGPGQGNWSSSKSSYGESFGPSSDPYRRKSPQQSARPGHSRTSSGEYGYFPPVPAMPASQYQSGRSSPDMRGMPRARTSSQPVQPMSRKAPPPSSWKASGV